MLRKKIFFLILFTGMLFWVKREEKDPVPQRPSLKIFSEQTSPEQTQRHYDFIKNLTYLLGFKNLDEKLWLNTLLQEGSREGVIRAHILDRKFLKLVRETVVPLSLPQEHQWKKYRVLFSLGENAQRYEKNIFALRLLMVQSLWKGAQEKESPAEYCSWFLEYLKLKNTKMPGTLPIKEWCLREKKDIFFSEWTLSLLKNFKS